MRRVSTSIAMIAMSATFALASVAPTFAMPMPAAPVAAAPAASPDVSQVQWRGYGYGPRPYYHGGGWYGGYRGYPYHRDGYRYYNGYWFPLAAFGAGAVVGGAIASQPRYYAPAPADGINPRHYEWCANRYRSYRAFDNTFQPNNGPRQQCYSPFY